jgi:hypothetical protein
MERGAAASEVCAEALHYLMRCGNIARIVSHEIESGQKSDDNVVDAIEGLLSMTRQPRTSKRLPAL